MVAIVRRPAAAVAVLALLGASLCWASPAGASGLPPVLAPDSYQGRIGQKLEVVAPGVLANDVDPEGDLLIVRLGWSVPSHGTVDLQPDGSFLYIPDPVHPGYDWFSYEAFDGTSWSNPQYVALTLWGAPVAQPDRYSMLGARVLLVHASEGVLANDSGQPPMVAKAARSLGQGRLDLREDGGFLYIPPRGFTGVDTFRYRVRDAAGVWSAPATITIHVARTNVAPVATPDAYELLEDTQLVVPAPGLLKNDVDRDGNALRVEVVDWPAEGSLDVREDGSFSYSTDTNQDNNATFTYRVTDEFSWSEPVEVFLDVIAVNDPPIAENDSYWLVQDTVLVEPAAGVLANDHDDIEFDNPVVWALVEGPAFGTLTLDADGGFVYTPDAGFVGADRFVYRVGDVGGPGGTAAVELSIDPAG